MLKKLEKKDIKSFLKLAEVTIGKLPECDAEKMYYHIHYTYMIKRLRLINSPAMNDVIEELERLISLLDKFPSYTHYQLEIFDSENDELVLEIPLSEKVVEYFKNKINSIDDPDLILCHPLENITESFITQRK